MSEAGTSRAIRRSDKRMVPRQVFKGCTPPRNGSDPLVTCLVESRHLPSEIRSPRITYEMALYVCKLGLPGGTCAIIHAHQA